MTADTTALSSLQHLTGLSVLRQSTQRSRSSPLTSSLRSLQLSVNWETVLNGPARVWDTCDLSPVVQLCTHSVLTAISFGVGAGTRPMTQRVLSKVAELSTAGSLRSLDISGFHITQEFLPHLCTLPHLTSLTLHTVGLPSILADRLEYYGSIPPGQDPLLKGLVQLKSQVRQSFGWIVWTWGALAARGTGLDRWAKYPKATASSHITCVLHAVRAVRHVAAVGSAQAFQGTQHAMLGPHSRQQERRERDGYTFATACLYPPPSLCCGAAGRVEHSLAAAEVPAA